MTNRRRDSRKAAFWRESVARWRRSGQSVRAYCAGAGLSEPSFYAWRRQLTMRDQAARPQRSAPHFVPVHVVPAAPPSAAPPLDVVLGNGRVIRVAPGFDAALLRQLVAVLEAAPC